MVRKITHFNLSVCLLTVLAVPAFASDAFPKPEILTELGKRRIKAWPRSNNSLSSKEFIKVFRDLFEQNVSSPGWEWSSKQVATHSPYHLNTLDTFASDQKNNMHQRRIAVLRIGEFPSENSKKILFGMIEKKPDLAVVSILGLQGQATSLSWKTWSQKETLLLLKYSKSKNELVAKSAKDTLRSLANQKKIERLKK